MKRALARVSLCLFAWFLLVAAQTPAVTQSFDNRSNTQLVATFPAKLTVGVLGNSWLPLDDLQDGQLSGMSVDYLRALVGPNVVIEAKAFPDAPQLLAAACAGKVDLLMSVARTPERERCLSFTAPYFRSSTSAVVRRDGDSYGSPAQLAGARIAVEKGFALERTIRERFPRAQIYTFPTTHAALAAVVQGGADVYLGFTPAVQYALTTGEFRSLRVAFEENSKTASLRFAVPRDRAALRDQLDRALASLNPADDAAIRVRWLSGNFDAKSVAGVPRLQLTQQEQAWLRSLPPLQVGFDNGWPPFSYVDSSGRPAGIAADYLNYLSRTLGVVFNRAHTADWPATIEAFQRGELAILATASSHDSRLANARHTSAYESYPLVIVGREAEPAARSLNDFASRRIVVSSHVAGSVPIAFQRIPADHVVVAPSLDDALKMVESGEADVLVGNVAAVDILLKQRYDGVLKILGTIGDSDALGFAVRPDLSPLAGLIDRALLAMPPAEKQRIRQKWVTGNAPASGLWSVTAVRLLPVLIGIGVALLITLRAYVLLQREVRLRKKTERELELQLNFQETMMKMVPYPLVAKDLDGRYIAVNEAYEQACGLRREAVIGRTTMEVQTWGEANSRMLDDITREMLNGGEAAQVEMQFERGQGNVRHGLFWTRICRGGDGQPACVLGTVVDITDIRRAEMRARETERRLFDVTRSLPAVVFQLRRTADGAYSFPYIGGDTRHLLGVRDGSQSSSDYVDFQRVCEEDRAFVLAELERSAHCETPVNMEFRFAGDQEIKWARAELVPRRESDGSVVWSGYWVDASVEHARSDELARARDLAEAASRAKDDFFAMMSHEIRTPMNGVLGLVEVLERTPLNADQGEMLGMIHESAGALLQILDDLLDYSKIEAGRLTIEAESIDIRELVDNAVGLLAGRAHEKGLKVRVDIASEVAATLRGDSVRLRQILFNLLGNAIKFTPLGEVDVCLSVFAQSDGVQTLEMVVEDTGIGIAPEEQAKLFEPFVQAESSTTRRFGGTGLGLTICRKLVDLMNGSLTLHSEPGSGTRMTVRLAMPVETQRYSVDGLRGKRGVVATGDARIAQALMHFGEALGLVLHRVSTDAPELCDRAALAEVDLLFVNEDVPLPAGVSPRTRVICLTEKPKPTGYRILDDNVRVSINPISWRGLGAACAAAMTGLPSVAPRSAGMPRSPEGGAPPPDRERAIASGRLILVAEDHPVNQELIRHQLALLGFACDVASDGAEALAALEHTSYGCLITDCHMPNVSGYELTRRIRESEQGGAYRLPILGITANTAPEDLNLCRDAGMDDSLVKPTRLATLRDYLSRWFGTDSAWQAGPSEAISTPIVAVRDVQNGAEPFVPVDLGHMTQLWGSESTVKALLDSFVSSVREDVQSLAPLLERVEAERMGVEGVREWLHRVAGAASVLQYPPLLKALEEYRREITVKPPERVRDEGLVLIDKCNAMLDGIEQQAALLV
ncbi:transporter substrate-binding domain-containing protein [Paraburkholderia sp. FT54]|uniref:ATP-binding protein n=1 Tax=Paraburkholderia sp. FT54 TaxID=3074437 RepID=UPI00287740A5|nr:transporter substrate-binding domain-containing protein [Paraburkholderia sp. FT54]WNC89384.1 transporter substrate-binding domain-containing protein [Paraburkholderia sp. FT54]